MLLWLVVVSRVKVLGLGRVRNISMVIRNVYRFWMFIYGMVVFFFMGGCYCWLVLGLVIGGW